ncbi:hypothetical protein [Methylocella sp.]|uniref:hypothetical protein n=1 Tax=Methylocella sp. TaxID=1978226 RepID=UPI0035B2A52C
MSHEGRAFLPARTQTSAARARVAGARLDRALAAAGVAAAAASTLFAGAMMSRDNSRPTFGGIEHLMIFAQPIGGPAARDARAAGVDPDATGSIAPRALGAKAYVLRHAAGTGLVAEGPKGRFDVRPGAELPGAGAVLAVENRNGRWRVETERGVILEDE